MQERVFKPRAAMLQRVAVLCGAVVAWLLLLDFSKKPLAAELEPSWMSVLTYAADIGLQFGRDVAYTYGPLVHLVFSSYSAHLFAPDFLLEIILKAIFVLLALAVGARLGAARRACFFVVLLAVTLISYQTLYLFGLVALGWLLLDRRGGDTAIIAGGLLFAVVAALIKFTFLWMAVFVIALTSATAIAERRVLRAAIVVLTFVGGVCVAWKLAGQSLSGLPAFFHTGLEITSGYSKTMGLASATRTLMMGAAVAILLVLQLAVLVMPGPTRRGFAAAGILLAASFMAWKLGFVRADAHTAEFFYFAVAASMAAPTLFQAGTRSTLRTGADWLASLIIIGLAATGVSSEVPTAWPTITDLAKTHLSANVRALLHPSAEREKWETAFAQNATSLALPRITNVIGSHSVDVLGYEQSIAVANGWHYTPNPTVQAYCDYTPLLAEATAAFYRSANAPDFVVFKLQPIDNRLPTLDNPELFVRLLRDFEPIIVERGYVLLKRNAQAAASLTSPRHSGGEGTAKLGQTIAVPEGMIWCELHMAYRPLGRLINFLYHTPEVNVQLTMDDGRLVQYRLLPNVAAAGFMLNPMPRFESDFVGIQAGRITPGITVRSVKVFSSPAVRQCFRQQLMWRFTYLPQVNKSALALHLYKEMRGFTDIFSRPANSVNSAMPVQRFIVDSQPFLLVHPIGEVRFKVPPGATAATGDFAIQPEAYTAGAVDGVTFQVDYLTEGAVSMPTTLFQRVLQPRRDPSDRGVQHFKVSLPAAHGELSLKTLPPPSGSIDWAWGGWSNIHFAPASVDQADSADE